MGASLSGPLMFDPFVDPEVQRARMMALKGTSPSTSSSSLASTASIVEATGAIIMGTNAPPLYEHALVGDWDALLRRIVTNPKEACYKDKCQNSPLHVSCRRQPPPEVVEALIKANPDALLSQTLDGLTPLHFSCFCGSSPETIQLVLEGETCLREMADRRGRTPLHCVCAGFRSPHRLAVVRMLLEVDTSCSTAFDERGRTPLSLIVDDYVEELHDALGDETSQQEAIQATTDPAGELYDCWQVVTLLLRAAYGGTLEEDEYRACGENEIHVGDKFRLLHAAVGIAGCPAAIIRLILKLNPDSIHDKDEDSNLPLHVACKTVGTPWSRKVVTSKKAGVIVYNADFGKARPTYDLTAELITAYPEATHQVDESGKVPFILAVESGKPWGACLKPLWDAHPLDNESFELLEKALHGGLTSLSLALRNETVKTITCVVPMWPASSVDLLVKDMIGFCQEAAATDDYSAEEIWNMTIQASALQGLAATLQSITSDAALEPATPQQALDMALPLLCSKNESVRVGGAKVLGATVLHMGIKATELVMNDIIFPAASTDNENDDDASSMSTMGLSAGSSHDMAQCDGDDFLHGRAMACYYMLERTPRILTEHQRSVVKQWMTHESVVVRKAACWAVGAALSSPNDLKYFKSPILKCMRATEDASVHLALSQSLSQAAMNHDKLFLCKSGLPVLDGALMVSMSRSTPQAVQQSFHAFLWHVLKRQETGLQEYMEMAEGENGRIMMSLVTKKNFSNKLPVVVEEELGECKRQR